MDTQSTRENNQAWQSHETSVDTQSTRVNNQAWQSQETSAAQGHETSAAQGHETSADTRPTNNKRENKSHDYQA